MLGKAKWKGYVALVVACVVGYFAILKWASLARQAAHGMFPDLGNGIGLLLRFAVTGYCAYIAYLHLSKRVVNNRWLSVGWGRVFFGMILLVAAIKGFVSQSPSQFQPSNTAELVGMLFAKIVLIPGLGVCLIAWGIARALAKQEPRERGHVMR
jgi:hypothetical protein